MMIVCKIRQKCYCEQSPAPSLKAGLAGYSVHARRPTKAGPLAMTPFFRIPRGTTERVLLG